jgi:serine/threonine protein kinase/tetratricopeptide (TPR) repeat protein
VSDPGQETLPACAECRRPIPPDLGFCPSCEKTRTRASNAVGSAESAPGAPRLIAGYRIVRELGAGGMGTVFEAFDERMKRTVALKILSRHISSSDRAADRFAREAWIAGKLNHPNLVRVYDRGQFEDLSFYSMELVDGGSLYDVIRRLKQWGEDREWGLAFGSREYVAWALTQIIAAARGLDYAHRQDVVHRDVKPMNVLLSRDPCTARIADFGLAIDMTATRLTTAGKVMGTVAYMAPEQIRGRDEEIDGRTDVYSLAVTLFELLTLELPFSGETQQLYLNAVLTSEAKRPRKLNERVGRDLEIVLRKALEKSPKDRYATASAFADDLENVLALKPITATPPTFASRVVKWARRQPYVAALAAVLLIAVPSVSILAVRSVRQQGRLQRIENERRLLEARRLLKDSRATDATALLTANLQVDPDDLEALRYRALSYNARWNLEKDASRRPELEKQALADLARAIELQPGAGWPYHVRAFLLKEFGRGPEAEADEQAAQRHTGGQPTSLDLLIDGILTLQAGDNAGAVRLFSDVIRLQADSAEAHLYRAEAYEGLGDVEKAVKDLEISTALQPSDAYPRHSLGRLLTVSGSLAEGEAQLREALDRKPDEAEIHQTLSDNLLRQGRARAGSGDSSGARDLFRRAEESARKALALDPNLPWSHVNLGAALMERNKLLATPDADLMKEAVDEFQKVISGPGTDPPGAAAGARAAALVNQCDALIQSADLERALAVCRTVTERAPNDANGHYNLAGVYALLGRSDDALASLRRDVELGDTDDQYLASDKWFASLRRDARFKALLERMKTAARR